MTRTTYTAYPLSRRSGRTQVILLIAAVAILAAAAGVALYIAVTAWSAAGAATTQNRQMRGEIATLKAVGNTLSQLGVYNQICDQALLGQSGAPGVYYYPCSNVRP